MRSNHFIPTVIDVNDSDDAYLEKLDRGFKDFEKSLKEIPAHEPLFIAGSDYLRRLFEVSNKDEEITPLEQVVRNLASKAKKADMHNDQVYKKKSIRLLQELEERREILIILNSLAAANKARREQAVRPVDKKQGAKDIVLLAGQFIYQDASKMVDHYLFHYKGKNPAFPAEAMSELKKLLPVATAVVTDPFNQDAYDRLFGHIGRIKLEGFDLGHKALGWSLILLGVGLLIAGTVILAGTYGTATPAAALAYKTGIALISSGAASLGVGVYFHYWSKPPLFNSLNKLRKSAEKVQKEKTKKQTPKP